MKKFILASMAFSLIATVAVALPKKGPGGKVVKESPNVPYTSSAPYQNASANFTTVLSTGFESPDWQVGHSVCGDQFAYGTICNYPVTNVCLFKNHAANQNCCPADDHNPLAGDPNPQTGWSMSPSGRHCRVPEITNINPFAGTQHLRFERDPLGGVPVGCTGSGSACRTRAITAQVGQSDISRAVWDLEIAWSATLGSPMVEVRGMDTSVGSVGLSSYNIWDPTGYLLIYDFDAAGFVVGAAWGNYVGQYKQYVADYNPCTDTVTYSYGGSVVHVEQFGFTPPYGSNAADTRGGTVADSAFYTQNNLPGSITDIDDHFVTFTPCSDACCDGVTGTCTDGVDAVDCAGPSNHHYPNVLCSQLGTDPKYPPACDRDTGACCDHGPLAGGPGPEGVCTDGVLPENCGGAQQTWSKNAACAPVAGACRVSDGSCDATGFCTFPLPSIGAPCVADADCDAPGFCTAGKVGDYCSADADCDIASVTCMEDTGSCCNTLEGTCTDGVLFADCSAAQRVWTKNGSCSTSACDAVLGACCDADPFGGCTDTTAAGCVCDKCTWSKLQSCSTVDCTHNSIPTVSEWGLVVLTLLLLTGAKVYFGRREAVA